MKLPRYPEVVAASMAWLSATVMGHATATAETQASDASAAEQSTRIWIDTQGREHSGSLLAFDHHVATIRLDGERVVFVTPSSLSEADRRYLRQWRQDHPQGAWVIPDHMPPWPGEVNIGRIEVETVDAHAAKKHYVWHSPHFSITADISLPLNTVADMATAFEATRHAIFRLPLGLAAKPKLPPRVRVARGTGFVWAPATALSPSSPMPKDQAPQSPAQQTGVGRLPVELYRSPQAYALAGGAPGTGGYYSAWRRTMLISLQNFGVEVGSTGRVKLDYQDKMYILRHEVSHQAMRDWLPFLPVWLSEGMAEYIAAVPYEAGRHRFQNLNGPFINYLNKWRYEENQRAIPMLSPAKLLSMTSKEWQDALSVGTPVLNYNSAALLTWYFIHQDGRKNAAHLAAYFQAIQKTPLDARKHLATHLLRGRSPQTIATEIRADWKTHGIEIVFE